jgi:general stress protein YciG
VSRDREHMSAIGRKGGERARGAQEPATDRSRAEARS